MKTMVLSDYYITIEQFKNDMTLLQSHTLYEMWNLGECI